MNIEKYDEKRENFRTLLLKLASSQTELHSIKEKKKIYLELEDIILEITKVLDIFIRTYFQ